MCQRLCTPSCFATWLLDVPQRCLGLKAIDYIDTVYCRQLTLNVAYGKCCSFHNHVKCDLACFGHWLSHQSALVSQQSPDLGDFISIFTHSCAGNDKLIVFPLQVEKDSVLLWGLKGNRTAVTMEITNNNTKWLILYDGEGKPWTVQLPHIATVAVQWVGFCILTERKTLVLKGLPPKSRLKQVGACISWAFPFFFLLAPWRITFGMFFHLCSTS